jgi:uncharacterized protein YcbK (DUF882 family)
MRSRFGTCVVYSGSRSLARNREVGGAPASRHVYARFPLEVAADVGFVDGTPNQWSAFARTLALRHDRGGVGAYSGHVHVDVGPRRDW